MDRRVNLWRYWQSLGLILLAAVLGVSCGGGNATPNPNPNPANLTLNTSSLDFGDVAVGSSKSNPITLTNSSPNGGPSVTITQATITGTGFSGNIPNMPVVVAPGQSATLTITFAPTAGGPASGTLSVVVQGVTDAVTVPLSGNGVAPGQLSVSPPAMNFGSVAVGSSKDLTGTLTAGASNINVSSASWSGQGYSVSGITFPVTIQASQSTTFAVTFAPQVAGTSSGSVSFVSDASNSPTAETFTGTGTQVTQHSVDLSWSPSIDPVQGYNVYRGTTSGGPYPTKLNSSPLPGTSYTDSTVQSGTTYFYVATAVDANFLESVYSNEASAVIPTP
jgi:hypothetical protein